jgi:hypothetical protein
LSGNVLQDSTGKCDKLRAVKRILPGDSRQGKVVSMLAYQLLCDMWM